MNPRLRLAAASVTLLVAVTGCASKPPVTSPSAPGPISPTGSAAPSSATPGGEPTSTAPEPSEDDDTKDCTWATLARPTTFDVPARDISEPMISLGLDAQGNVAAPPHDQKFSVGWWNGGPKVGSDQGHVILTAHTWYGDVALGNVLYDRTQGLHPGDVIRISDGSQTVCYRYTHTITIDVATYNPNSTVWINPNGDPQLTIMICWNYSTKTGEWQQRLVFFADPIKP